MYLVVRTFRYFDWKTRKIQKLRQISFRYADLRDTSRWSLVTMASVFSMLVQELLHWYLFAAKCQQI